MFVLLLSEENGAIFCQVTGRRRHSVELPQGGLEVPCTLTFVGPTREIGKVRKLNFRSSTYHKHTASSYSKKKKLQDAEQDEECSDSDADLYWLTFQGCLLTNSDREAIVSNGLLIDRHINFAQLLLQHQFPAAEELQNTLFQEKKRQSKIIRGIQIIHDRGNHWVVAYLQSKDESVEVHTVKNRVLVRMFKYNTPKGVKQNCGLGELFWHGMIAFVKLKCI